MKKALVLFMMFTVLLGCKDDRKAQDDATQGINEIATEDGKTVKQNDGLIAIHGKFLYYSDAAVLQTPTEVYAVVIDDKMHELVEQTKQYKKQPEDMVPVTIRGRMFKKDPDEEGWENKIEIKEILKVSEPSPEDQDIITIGKEK